MSFDLEIEFSGLCLYVVHPDGNQVAVLMPDGRRRSNPDPFHADETDAVPHVGYLQANAADMGISLPGGEEGGAPRYELIHRFDRQAVDFDGAFSTASLTNGLKFPVFDQFAPDVELRPGLFGTEPPAELLMRMVLTGGTFESTQEEPIWRFTNLLNSEAEEEYGGQFASFAVWKRSVDAEVLNLRILDFEGNVQATLPLAPSTTGGKVCLKISNLCSDNPLEWVDLPIRKVTGPDNDFRWLYRLLQLPEGGSIETLVSEEAHFPIPLPVDLGGEVGADDCMGGSLTSSFPIY
jgi:hypothetical protein